MTEKIFYKMKLHPDEEGLTLYTLKYVVIGESDCYFYAVKETDKGLANFAGKKRSESPVQCARRLKILKKIDKRNSRVAFETEQQAFLHLVFLKRKQLQHMKREAAFINEFLKHSEKDIECFKSKSFCNSTWRTIPGTEDLVKEYLCFN